MSATAAAAAPPSKIDLEDEEHHHHPKYLAYSESILRVLQSFEKAKEWADLISFLQKLSKAIGKPIHPFPIIPYKLVVAKRLAQCLNPALPSGVHLEALETVEIIFARIGRERTARDLAYYSFGVLPLFQHDSTLTKPRILDLFEKYYVPLGAQLNTCLYGLIAALLPAIEDETSEFYHRTLKVLDQLSQAVGKPQFFRGIWRALLQGKEIRRPAVHYLLSRLPPRMGSDNPLLADYIADRPLVVRALVRALHEDNLLALRYVLELLNAHFPLHLCLFKPGEMEELTCAALYVVTKRDLSITKRLYSWLLGGSTQDNQIAYFLAHAKSVTVNAIQRMMESSDKDLAHPRTTPYRIIMYILDKPEIGNNIIEDIMIPALVPLVKCKETPHAKEIVKSVQRMCDSSQPAMVWNQIAALATVPSDPPASSTFISKLTILQRLEVVEACIDVLNVHEEETRRVHLAHLLANLLLLIDWMIRGNSDDREARAACETALKLLVRLRAESRKQQHQHASDTTGGAPAAASAPAKGPAAHTSFVPTEWEQCVHLSQQLIGSLLENAAHSTASAVFKSVCKVVGKVCTYFTASSNPILSNALPNTMTEEAEEGLLTRLPPYLQRIVAVTKNEGAQAVVATALLLKLMSAAPNWALSLELCHSLLSCRPLLMKIAAALWQQVSLDDEHTPAICALLLMRLRALNEDIVNTTIAECLTGAASEERLKHFERFTAVWNLCQTDSHIRKLRLPVSAFGSNLFLVLEALLEDDLTSTLPHTPALRSHVRSWVLETMHARHFHALVDPILQLVLESSVASALNRQYVRPFDANRVRHGLRLLMRVLALDYLLLRYLAQSDLKITPSLHQLADRLRLYEELPTVLQNEESYLHLLIATALRLAQAEVAAGSAFGTENAFVKYKAVEFLEFVFTRLAAVQIDSARHVALITYAPLLDLLNASILRTDWLLQIHLLQALKLVVVLLAHQPRAQQCTAQLLDVVVGALERLQGQVRRDWLEFIHFALPYLTSVGKVIAPLLTTLCKLLQLPGGTESHKRLCLEHLYLLLQQSLQVSGGAAAETPAHATPSEPESRSITEVVKHFMISYSSQLLGQSASSVSVEIREEVSKQLDSMIQVLVQVWESLDSTPSSTPRTANGPVRKSLLSSTSTLRSAAASAAPFNGDESLRLLVRRVLDLLLAHLPAQVVDVLVSKWLSHRTALAVLLTNLDNASYSLVLHHLNAVLSASTAPPSENTKAPPSRTPDVLDLACHFLQHSRKEIHQNSWTFVTVLIHTALTRDALRVDAGGSGLPSAFTLWQLVSLLRIWLVRDTQSLADRKAAKAYQDTLQKLLEAFIGLWGKISSGNLVEPAFEKQLTPLTPAQRANSSHAMALVGRELLPLLDAVYEEKDRIATVLMPLIAVINPFLLFPKGTPAVDSRYILSLLVLDELCEFTYTQRAWKREALDAFNDDQFFHFADPRAVGVWSRVVNLFMAKDKAAFSALVRNVGVAPGGLFSGPKDPKLFLSLQLKRLAFTVLAAQFDQYLPQLPLIEEKLVEVAKTSSGAQRELFLCLRALVARISVTRLRSFWPFVLSEMIRVLDHRKATEATLDAVKLLDLVTTLTPNQFIVYEWMFLVDESTSHPESAFRPLLQHFSSRLAETSGSAGAIAAPVVRSRPGVAGAPQPLRLIIDPSLSATIGGPVELEAILNDFSRLKTHRMLHSTADVDAQSIQALFNADLMSDDRLGGVAARNGGHHLPAESLSMEDFEDEGEGKLPTMSHLAEPPANNHSEGKQ